MKVTESSKSQNEVPRDTSIPGGGASLESILCTEELQRRPSRLPDYEKENSSLVKLVSALADSPNTVLQALAETILHITQCDSAGLSLLTRDGKTPDVCGQRFYWPAIAGMWKPHIGKGTPRNFGPCGDVLDQNRTLLFKHFERRYPYFEPVTPVIEECLLVPFYVAGEAVGTIWAIMHSNRRKFDAEDERVMASLGKFASSAYQAMAHMEDLKIQVAQREKAEAEVRELAKGLEAKIRRLVEANVVGIIMWSLEGRITEANEAFLRMVQYNREEVASGLVRWTDLTPAEWHDRDEQAIKGLKTTGTFQPLEKEYFRKDGSRVPVLVGGASFEASGNEGVAFVLDLSEQKRSEESYRIVVETASDAVITVDESGLILFTNPATKRIFGYDSAELIGRPLTTLMPDFMRKLHEAGFKRYLATGQRHINWQGTEFIGMRKNGEEFPLEISFGEQIRNGQRSFTGFVRDISEKKRAEQAFKHLVVGTAATTGSDFFQSLVQHIAQALRARYAFVTTCDDQKRARTLAFWKGDRFGENFEFNITDTPCEKVLHGEVCCYKQGLQGLFPRDKLLADWQAESYLGVPMLDRSNRVIGHIAILNNKPMEADVRAVDLLKIFASRAAAELKRQKAEEELRAALQEGERMREELAHLAHQNRVSTMGELAASLAHEIKQPISAAMTDARTCSRWLTRDHPDLAEAQTAASRVVKDVARASEIIGRVKSLFKKDCLQREEVDINELIQEMIALLRSEASRHSISIHRDFSIDLPPIMADRVQLQQVLMNLMLNSIEAMKSMDTPGKLTIKSQQDDSGQLLISVVDTGVGVLPEKIEQIFNAFFTSKPQGTGMGLAISRSIIVSHGGRLWAVSNPESGATFHFTLPTRRNADQAA
jgi:PAS domain S-box-containing protein